MTWGVWVTIALQGCRKRDFTHDAETEIAVGWWVPAASNVAPDSRPVEHPLDRCVYIDTDFRIRATVINCERRERHWLTSQLLPRATRRMRRETTMDGSLVSSKHR